MSGVHLSSIPRLLFGVDALSRNTFLFCLFSCLVVPAVLVHTFWFHSGSKVDESEVVLFSIGFFGGNLDPVWDGYGHLTMYLLSLVLAAYSYLGALITDQTFNNFVVEQLFTEKFYPVARLIMASAAVFGVLCGSKILLELKVNKAIAIVFFFAVCLSPTLQYFANYLRSDLLVAVFTTLTILCLAKAKNATGVFRAVMFGAAAVACKVSALSIAVLLSFACLVMLYDRRINFTQCFFLAIVFIGLIWGFSPYMSYLELLEVIINAEYSGSEVQLLRLEYVGLSKKLLGIYELHVNALGIWGCLLGALSLLWLGRGEEGRRIALLWVALISILLPYLFGSTLRDYWFLPSYLVLALLAFFSIDRLLRLLPIQGSRHIGSFAVLVLGALTILSPAFALMNKYIDLQSSYQPSNKVLAHRWLSDQISGRSSVLVDLNFSYVYPPIYDLNYLSHARTFSGLFAYERENNQYLASIFEEYLYGKYFLENVDAQHGFITVTELRIDLEGAVTRLTMPRVCSKFSNKCIQPTLVSTNDLDIIEKHKDELVVSPTGRDAYLVFSIDKVISLDESMILRLETDAKRWQFFYSINQGAKPTRQIASAFFYGHSAVPLKMTGLKPGVHWLAPGDFASEKVRAPESAVLLTSPWSRMRFDRILASSEAGSIKASQAKKQVDWYTNFLKEDLLFKAEGMVGKSIHIYQIPEDLLYPEVQSN